MYLNAGGYAPYTGLGRYGMAGGPVELLAAPEPEATESKRKTTKKADTR